jgi:anhydro-N-acetylmuramic acid kinase
MLFSNYAACVNLGGFANISLERNNRRVAWDVCPLNFVMNVLASRANARMRYDRNGDLARQGQPIEILLQKLEALACETESDT